MQRRELIHAAGWLAGLGLALVCLPGSGLAEQGGSRFTLVLGGAAVKDSQTGPGP
jgi:hypothetical protein